jgi:2-methylcitrate dehydratase PrpD
MSEQPAPPFALRLAEKICGITADNVTELARKRARHSIIDTVAVTLAGIPEACTQILLKIGGIAQGPGDALIFGTDRRTSALDATFVNGTASHALDFDDFSGVFGGHQSVPLIAPLIAIGEERKVSGRQLMLAYLVGVETELKLARAVHYHHYDKGWHPTSTLGTIGAAAAVAHLLKLGPQRTATALAIAASLSSGLKSNFGTMTKPLHIGQCGRNGLMAALLAEAGFDANHSAYEHQQGFFNVFNGPGLFDMEKALTDWWSPAEIEQKGIALKQFPCCGSTHPAIVLALALRRDENIRAGDIAKIQILPNGRRLRHTNTPHPTTSLKAKFSVQYVVARALLTGAVRLKDFEGDAHHDPEIAKLLDITDAEPHPEMTESSSQQWGAEVVVTMKDGRKLSRRVDNMVGRDGDHPMTNDELWEKFDDCARRSLPREQIAPLFERLETIDAVTDLHQVTQLAQVSRLHERAAPARVAFAPRGAEQAPETTWVP